MFREFYPQTHIILTRENREGEGKSEAWEGRDGREGAENGRDGRAGQDRDMEKQQKFVKF
jgi:hypothetical protein